MASIITSPATPVVGDAVVVALDAPLGTQLDVVLTSVPSGSAIPTGRIAPPFAFVPDRPGTYGVAISDLREYLSAPSYDGDPVAGLGRTELVGFVLGSVLVGTRFTLPIRTTAGRGATLRLAIGCTDRPAAPVLAAELVAPLDELSRLAALDAGVTAALAALVGVDASAMGAQFPGAVAALVAAYEAHRFAEGVHPALDATNAVRLATPYAEATAIASLNDLRERVARHMAYGLPGGGWHLVDDTRNLPIAGPARTLGEAMVLYADLALRVLPRHFQQSPTSAPPACHLSADSTPTPASDALSTVVAALLDALAARSAPAPAGESQVVEDAVRAYGFSVM